MDKQNKAYEEKRYKLQCELQTAYEEQSFDTILAKVLELEAIAIEEGKRLERESKGIVLPIDIKGTVDDAITKTRQSTLSEVIGMVKGMIRTSIELRPIDVSGSIEPTDFNVGYNYAIKELKSRLEKMKEEGK